jgi:ABC-type glycerol-3-phosphate transport system substrate-binding protein
MKNHSPKTLKYWFFILTSLVLVLLLISCSGSPTDDTPTPTAENNDSPRPTGTSTSNQVSPTPTVNHIEINVDPEDLDGLSIRFVHPYNGEIGEIIQDIAMKFSLSNPWGIWVEVEGQGSENLLLEKVQSDIDRGDIPELIAAHAYTLSWLEGDYTSIPMTDYINHPEWGIDPASQKDIPQVYLDQYTANGHLTALPVAPQASVLFYNQTWAEVLGFAASPTDEDSFAEMACEATAANLVDNNEENDFTGGYLMNYDPWVLFSWYRAFDGEIAENEIPQFNNDAGQSAFGYLESLYAPEKNCIWVGRQAEPYWYFANRYVLMYAGTLDQIPSQVGWMAQAQNDDKWTVTGFPGPAGEIMLVDGPGLFIMESNPEAQLGAWLFAKHLVTPEIQARLVQSLFTLPVRSSTLEQLNDFVSAYPQWAAAVEMVSNANHLPISEGWGYGRWLLEDAIRRTFVTEEEDLTIILEQLDEMITEYEGITP